MIETKKLVKRFGSFVALDSLDMRVEDGSVYGLVGPNGAGKSTLIRHVLGCYRPDGGEVLVDGRPVYENAPLKARIASIPDDFYYPVTATLAERRRYYTMFYPQFDNARWEKLRPAFPAIDEKCPLRQLSKGMQKQAAFWLALCCRPDLLVLDEPVDGLDPVMRRQVWQLLLDDCAENGTTVLVSSHNLRELEDVCDHVGILDHGKMLLERSLGELQEGLFKVQLAYDEDRPLAAPPPILKLLHESTQGRVHTLILRGTADEIRRAYLPGKPILLDLLPLTLEEIFIYELGGMNDAVKEILL